MKYSNQQIKNALESMKRGDVVSAKIVKSVYEDLGVKVPKDLVAHFEVCERIVAESVLDNVFDNICRINSASKDNSRMSYRVDNINTRDLNDIVSTLCSCYEDVSKTKTQRFYPGLYSYDDHKKGVELMSKDLVDVVRDKMKFDKPLIGLASDVTHGVELIFSKGDKILSYWVFDMDNESAHAYYICDNMFHEVNEVCRMFKSDRVPVKLNGKEDILKKSDVFYSVIGSPYFLSTVKIDKDVKDLISSLENNIERKRFIKRLVDQLKNESDPQRLEKLRHNICTHISLLDEANYEFLDEDSQKILNEKLFH